MRFSYSALWWRLSGAGLFLNGPGRVESGRSICWLDRALGMMVLLRALTPNSPSASKGSVMFSGTIRHNLGTHSDSKMTSLSGRLWGRRDCRRTSEGKLEVAARSRGRARYLHRENTNPCILFEI